MEEPKYKIISGENLNILTELDGIINGTSSFLWYAINKENEKNDENNSENLEKHISFPNLSEIGELQEKLIERINQEYRKKVNCVEEKLLNMTRA